MVEENFAIALLFYANPANILLGSQNQGCVSDVALQILKTPGFLYEYIQHMLRIGCTSDQHTIRGVFPVIHVMAAMDQIQQKCNFILKLHDDTPILLLSYHISLEVAMFCSFKP